MVGEGGGWPQAQADLKQQLRGRGLCALAAVDQARRVQEHPDALVAGPREPQAVGLAPESPVDFGEGQRPVVEPNERGEEPQRDPRCEGGQRASDGKHPSSVAAELSRVCVNSAPKAQVTRCYNHGVRGAPGCASMRVAATAGIRGK